MISNNSIKLEKSKINFHYEDIRKSHTSILDSKNESKEMHKQII